MSTHKQIDRICIIVFVILLFFTAAGVGLWTLGLSLGLLSSDTSMGYETRLFDTSTVHTIDIVMDDWDSFVESCEDEEYEACAVVIDNEAYKNVGIRAKGNTSLSSVAAYGNDRYSFKIEFDCYENGKTYYGLDKLVLNNMIQDNTYMKDYLSYQMMGNFGVDSPLCSYVYITVNGQEWGLYLAVEGVEDSFLERNNGSSYGELYKPDSTGMGGGGGMKSDDVSLIYTDDDYESYSNIFNNAKTDITDADKNRLIASLKKLNQGESILDIVNVEEVIRYFVVHNFVCNFDSYTGSIIHNYYLYEENGEFSMIPWDYNLSFGGFQSATDAKSLVNYPIDTPVSGGTVDSRPMLAWIFNSEEYTEMYHEYFAEFIATYFDSEYFTNLIESVSVMISPYVEKDTTKFCTYEEFEEGVLALKEFCLLRADSVSGQLDGTIPSTAAGQEETDAGLVEAASLSISAMGSMGNTMGRGNNMGNPPGQEGNTEERAEENTVPAMAEVEDTQAGAADGRMQKPTQPGAQQIESQSSDKTVIWILFGVSVAVLFAGLIFAFRFKR